MTSPLFRDDIFINIYARLIQYAVSDVFLPIFVLILAVLALGVYVLRHDFGNRYDFLFCDKSQEKISLPSGLFFCACIVIHSFSLFYVEGSIFSNVDIMHDGFNTGTWQQYGYLSRLNPLVFLNLTILYGITHNFFVITLYLIVTNLLLMFLLYRLFDMIPASGRLWILGLVMLLPSYFGINNIVFTEREALIYIVSSLLCLKKWVMVKKLHWIGLFLFFANVAIYTKESILLFYVGLVVVSLGVAIYQGTFNVASFGHPLRTIRQFPLEFLIGVTVVIFVLQYVVVIRDVIDNPYLQSSRYGLWPQVWNLYWFEILLIVVSVPFMILSKKSCPLLTLLYWSNLFGIAYIIGYLRLCPTGCFANRTYYVVVPMMFIMICLSGKLYLKRFFYVFAAGVLAVSGWINFEIVSRDIGKDSLEVATYLSKIPHLRVHLDSNFAKTWWHCFVWPNAFKTAYPSRDVVFKVDECFVYENVAETTKNYGIDVTKNINPGDYYLISKEKDYSSDLNKLSDYRCEKAFENNFYLLYRIEARAQ